ncbi:MAG TPA: malectin domain-containing carbohydrate-binding protein [Terracidiphilus sp.]|nr:malectin domain-containing carbohydrate-binding protein [Terracidiphilus sp.]
MTVENSSPNGFTESRAELRAVLESKEFLRAPRLAHLLSYLCEKQFAGEECQIKEYSIGVEVFGRGASFDQDSDSIVRVEANRLRKRLADYYAGDGATHQLQITIPVGQYVPRFADCHRAVSNGNIPTAGGPIGAPQAIEELPPSARARRMQRLPNWVSISAAAVLLAIIFVYGWRLARTAKEPPPTGEVSQRTAPFDDSPIGLPVGPEIRILAGAPRSLVDHAGKLWSADAWFTGGTVVKSAVAHVWRTQEQAFYRNSRQGRFRYDIPLKKGIYELRLHLAETAYDPESTETSGEGSRIMNVRANGKSLLSAFDLTADAGGSSTADVKIFPGIVPAADGQLHLEFEGETGAGAILQAIEILPGAHGHMLPVRVLPRQTPYYSNDSRWWSPDDYFEGGRLAAYGAPPSGTDDPDLYATERWGNFSYAIPVSPGRYVLTLYFAGRHVEPDQSAESAGDGEPKTARLFNVFCNGHALLENFDLKKETREKDILIRRFENLEPNAQGKLLLNFVPVDGYATVSGIEVLAQ